MGAFFDGLGTLVQTAELFLIVKLLKVVDVLAILFSLFDELLIHLTLESVSDQKILDRHTRDKTRGKGNYKIRFH